MADGTKFSVARAAAGLAEMEPPRLCRGADIHGDRVGGADLTVLSDGTMALPFRALAPWAPGGALEETLGLSRPPERAQGELNAFLIRKGPSLVLVDTGAGASWQGGTGRLLDHMAAHGIDPGEITHVVLTHLHPDHAWGALRSDGSLAFPNATHVVGRAETGFWGEPGLADRLSPFARTAVEGAQAVLHGIGDRRRDVSEGDEVIPGLRVLDTPGHTPGHISLMLEEGPGLIVTGDAVVNDVVSFAHPDWAFGFDMDGDTAAISRRRLLDLAAREGHLVAGYHWSWPGLGRVEPADAGFRLRA